MEFMDYFADIKTIAGAAKRWKALAKRYHPDMAEGSTVLMQEINRQYQAYIHAQRNQRDSERAEQRQKEPHWDAPEVEIPDPEDFPVRERTSLSDGTTMPFYTNEQRNVIVDSALNLTETVVGHTLRNIFNRMKR